MKYFFLMVLFFANSSFASEKNLCENVADDRLLTVKIWIHNGSEWSKKENQEKLEKSIELFKVNLKRAGVEVNILFDSFEFDGVAVNQLLENSYVSGEDNEFSIYSKNTVFESIPVERFKSSHLNIFLTHTLGFSDKKGNVSVNKVVQGTANGINMPVCDVSTNPLCLTGVLMGANGKFKETTFRVIGNRMTHEAGHLLGLYHVSGAGGFIGLKQLEPGVDIVKNLMNTGRDPLEKDKEQSFSCKQAYIMKKHPLLKSDSENKGCISIEHVDLIKSKFPQFKKFFNKSEKAFCSIEKQESELKVIKALSLIYSIGKVSPPQKHFLTDFNYPVLESQSRSWWGYLLERVDKLEFTDSKICDGAVMYVSHKVKKTIFACSRHIKKISFYKLANVLIHEARHLDGFRHVESCINSDLLKKDKVYSQCEDEEGAFSVQMQFVVQSIAFLIRQDRFDEELKKIYLQDLVFAKQHINYLN